jgi:hypothetical protein
MMEPISLRGTTWRIVSSTCWKSYSADSMRMPGAGAHQRHLAGIDFGEAVGADKHEQDSGAGNDCSGNA